MRYKPAWDVIGRLEQPVPQATIDEVNGILFTQDPPQSALAEIEVCVVLGSRNCEYKARRAAELFGANERVVFVACGANPTLSGPPEAELIRAILLTEGIAQERVLLDEHSTNTVENLRHAERLIATRIAEPRSKRIAILSSGFHRLHVLASLPPSLAHALYVSATGPFSGPETWHTNPMGRGIILHELTRPTFSRGSRSSPASAPRERGL